MTWCRLLSCRYALHLVCLPDGGETSAVHRRGIVPPKQKLIVALDIHEIRFIHRRPLFLIQRHLQDSQHGVRENSVAHSARASCAVKQPYTSSTQCQGPDTFLECIKSIRHSLPADEASRQHWNNRSRRSRKGGRDAITQSCRLTSHRQL